MDLFQSISDEESKRSNYMTNVQAVVTALFRTAIGQSYPMYSKTKALVTPSTTERFGDYKCIAAMPIAQVRVCIPHCLHCSDGNCIICSF